jgi:hypothetical protein
VPEELARLVCGLPALERTGYDREIRQRSQQRFVLLVLAVHADADDACTIALDTLVGFTGLAHSTVRSAIEHWEASGYLTRSYKTGQATASVYTFDRARLHADQPLVTARAHASIYRLVDHGLSAALAGRLATNGLPDIATLEAILSRFNDEPDSVKSRGFARYLDIDNVGTTSAQKIRGAYARYRESVDS